MSETFYWWCDRTLYHSHPVTRQEKMRLVDAIAPFLRYQLEGDRTSKLGHFATRQQQMRVAEAIAFSVSSDWTL